MVRVSDSLGRPIIRALDDAPANLRPLREVVDGMKRKTRGNNDGVTSIDKIDAPPIRVDVSVKAFNYNPKHSEFEFNRQLDEQIDTLQNVSLDDWIRRRKEYDPKHRTSDSLRAQENARSEAFENHVAELVGNDVPYDEAVEQANRWMSTQAATHRLDGIAGGDVADISGVGDSGVNSSLGSQWRWRVGDIDSAVDDFVKANPGVDLSNTFMNITFR